MAGGPGSKSSLAVWYHHKKDVITLMLYIQPGAKRTEVVGTHDDSLKIRLGAPPIEGRANDTLLHFIAEKFSVPVRNVRLKQGARSRHKVVLVTDSAIEPTDLLND